MVKEKRKGRLNKEGGGEFIGFGAFAAANSDALSLIASSVASTTQASDAKGTSPLLSPVYTGSDDSLNILFPRIGQKRDATTKSKALSELASYFQDESQPKKNQAEALSHYLYLYQSKLSYDNTPRIRALCVQVCQRAQERLPKVWNTLVCVDAADETNYRNVQIVGMLLCGRADPAAEVRSAANDFNESLTNGSKNDSNAVCSQYAYQGMWMYVTRILSYNNPMAMHEDLFQKGSVSMSLTEHQKEELEERYVRIVGTAIEGMQLFVKELRVAAYMSNERKRCDAEFSKFMTPESTKVLWKQISSNKPSLRGKTYSLLATVCQKVPFLLDVDKTGKLFLHSLGSEKEASNVNAILEALLAFIASRPKAERTSTMGKYSKALAKLFKKGCNGATAAHWTPMVLPIVALLPQELDSAGSDGLPPQVNVLTSIWEGRTHVVSVADSFQVINAVAETSAFLLQQETHVFMEVIAKCWSHACQSYLTASELLTGPAVGAHAKLGNTLGLNLVKLNKACLENPESAVGSLSESFWNPIMNSVTMQEDVSTRYLTTLLRPVEEQLAASTEIISPYFSGVLRNKFQASMKGAIDTANWMPSKDDYMLWIVILKLVPSCTLFDGEGSITNLETFVTNYVLAWIVRHTSTLSEQQSKSSALLDMQLFLAATKTLKFEEATTLWITILREMIAVIPDLRILVDCLSFLSQHGWAAENMVGSSNEQFANFCINVAETAVTESSKYSPHHNLDEDDSASQTIGDNLDGNYNQRLEFLQCCVGLQPERLPAMLVGDRVIQAWIDCSCSMNGVVMEVNPVLETLVCMVKNGMLRNKQENTVRILLQSWRVGGRLWDENVLPFLSAPVNKELCIQVNGKAKNESTDQIHRLAAETLFDEDAAWVWTSRACRLLEICAEESSNTLPLRSLSAVGLGSLDLWRSEPSQYLAICTTQIIKRTNPHKRWQLVINSETETFDLLVHILIHLSGGGITSLKADRALRRIDLSSMMLESMGYPIGNGQNVEATIDQCVATLQEMLQASAKNEKRLSRAIAVLSQLVEALFVSIRPKPPATEEILCESDVRVGDIAWYFGNPENPMERESCKIVKIHSDIPQEMYFTIQLNRDGTVHERQTVSHRLRKQNTSGEQPTEGDRGGFIYIEDLDDNQKEERERLSNEIMTKLLKDFGMHTPSLCYEIYSILITQVGLVRNKGVGSLHYAVLQNLMEIANSLKRVLRCEMVDSDRINLLLTRLGFALGSGMNVPPSEYGVSLLGIDIVDPMPYLLTLYNDGDQDKTRGIDHGAAQFLAISAPATESRELRNSAFSVLFQVVARLLMREKSVFDTSDYVALRAMEVAQRESHNSSERESRLQDSEEKTITALVKAFAEKWEDDPITSNIGNGFPPVPSWPSLPVVQHVFNASLKSRPRSVSISCRHCIDALVGHLYTPAKRWYAMAFLKKIAEKRQALHEDESEDDIINPTTLRKLDEWCDGLLEEEAEELCDDVGVVAEWVSARQMNDIESWHDDDRIDDNIGCGRMLSWLFFLDVVDAASAKDSANRSSFLTYASLCDATSDMLDLALVYGNIGTVNRYKFDDIISFDDMLARHTGGSADTPDFSKLASLVVFRSVEVLPTLSKTWWEMHCPNKLSGTVHDFVETKVSPIVLNEALESIKQATAFGDMEVKGSSATGEVTATYVQDDFILSVMIKFPNSFPFRRAEVDCSKTLGVSVARSKRWALLISQMINNQGGTLKDALLLWKENVDKEFQGVEPCPVCYSVLHVKSHKLPNMECSTCHNNFHRDCLMEWFQSSGKTSCVICQQPWHGVKSASIS